MHSELHIEWIKPFSHTRAFKAGEVLFRRGDPATSMFYVLDGRYRVVELGVDLDAGHIFGEIGLLSERNARTQSMTCVED